MYLNVIWVCYTIFTRKYSKILCYCTKFVYHFRNF